MEFYRSRGIVITRAKGARLSGPMLRKLDAAQSAIDSSLLRAGCPPAFLCAFESAMTRQAGVGFQRLNRRAAERAAELKKKIEAHPEFTPSDVQRLREQTFKEELREEAYGRFCLTPENVCVWGGSRSAADTPRTCCFAARRAKHACRSTRTLSLVCTNLLGNWIAECLNTPVAPRPSRWLGTRETYSHVCIRIHTACRYACIRVTW